VPGSIFRGSFGGWLAGCRALVPTGSVLGARGAGVRAANGGHRGLQSAAHRCIGDRFGKRRPALFGRGPSSFAFRPRKVRKWNKPWGQAGPGSLRNHPARTASAIPFAKSHFRKERWLSWRDTPFHWFFRKRLGADAISPERPCLGGAFGVAGTKARTGRWARRPARGARGPVAGEFAVWCKFSFIALSGRRGPPDLPGSRTRASSLVGICTSTNAPGPAGGSSEKVGVGIGLRRGPRRPLYGRVQKFAIVWARLWLVFVFKKPVIGSKTGPR
jgi:hypothetical protein